MFPFQVKIPYNVVFEVKTNICGTLKKFYINVQTFCFADT